MHCNSTRNKRSNNYPNLEYNNKLDLQSSYLINEIKRKNTSLLIPIYITNKKIYIKNKLLTNKNSHTYLKGKDNIKKLISRNIHKNILPKNLSEDNIHIRKTPLIEKDSNIYNKVPFSSLYNLASLNSKNKNNHNKSAIVSNNNYKSILQADNTKGRNDKKNNAFFGLENFMKEKFYADTENKLKNKIESRSFRNDEMIKEKIIFMKKFGIFWKGLIQYCMPIIKLKKYKIDYKNKNKGNNINIINGYMYKNNQNINSSNKNKALSLPKIDSSKFKFY